MSKEFKSFADVIAQISNEQIIRNASFWLNAIVTRGIDLDRAMVPNEEPDAVPSSPENQE